MPAKTRIWTCPTCERAGVRAPERMRREDVRRYCLDCSKDTGRLVERISASLDRERAERAGRQEARRKEQKERQRQADLSRRLVDGVDLEREFRRLCRLPLFGGRDGSLAKHPPELRIRRAAKAQARAVSVEPSRIVISIWPTRSAEHAVAWLLWALAWAHKTRSASDRPLPAVLGDGADDAWPGLGTLRGSNDAETVASLVVALQAGGHLQRAPVQ